MSAVRLDHQDRSSFLEASGECSTSDGLGQLMLIDAMKKAVIASQQIASVALVVEAIDERAVSFYQKFGFIGFQSSCDRLYLPMKTIEKLI